jgi:transcription antitermination factor NusG
MSASVIALDGNGSRPIESPSAIVSNSADYLCGTHWFAVWTKSRQEKVTAAMIQSLGVTNFLPLRTESRQWSDRKQTVNVPLFSGYLFVRMSLSDGSKRRVLQVPGVAGFVGNSHGPLPVPDDQIEAVRTVIERRIECTVHPLLEEGDKVRVLRGPLAGMEGRLIRSNSLTRLVISIGMIHRSLAVQVDRDDVERFEDCAAALESVRPFGEAPAQVRAAAHRFGALERSIQ